MLCMNWMYRCIYFAKDALLEVAKPFDLGNDEALLEPLTFDGKTAGADMVLPVAGRFVAFVAYDVTLDLAPPDLPMDPRDWLASDASLARS